MDDLSESVARAIESTSDEDSFLKILTTDGGCVLIKTDTEFHKILAKVVYVIDAHGNLVERVEDYISKQIDFCWRFSLSDG